MATIRRKKQILNSVKNLPFGMHYTSDLATSIESSNLPSQGSSTDLTSSMQPKIGDSRGRFAMAKFELTRAYNRGEGKG